MVLIEKIYLNAFADCVNLTSIVIPKSVLVMGKGAFDGCTNLTIYCEAISRPTSWVEDWNPDNRPVVWAYNLTLNIIFDSDGGTRVENQVVAYKEKISE